MSEGIVKCIIAHNYDRHLECQQALRLPDFSPQSQDWAALHLIRERGAMPAIDAGRLSVAIDLCAAIWASLPGNSYGQPEHPLRTCKPLMGELAGCWPDHLPAIDPRSLRRTTAPTFQH
ncbi:hypothetical protein [Acidocella sp.]|uniref:hypothetical protein n=1 Tax=Acidocella sp. TaxID=50710 RepID=UPI00261C57E6|nr:hypothetical protein [Acidocella sp.]